jgi:hypothetical protein
MSRFRHRADLGAGHDDRPGTPAALAVGRRLVFRLIHARAGRYTGVRKQVETEVTATQVTYGYARTDLESVGGDNPCAGSNATSTATCCPRGTRHHAPVARRQARTLP